MATPTLNKKQLKSTLSAKKNKTKETIKNVVTTPYNNSYWPQISAEDHNTLKQILEHNLPKIKNEKINIPWQELKHIPKSKRKEFREEYIKNYQTEISKDARKGIFMGVNDVTKLLENNLASAVIISSDVQPKLMVQHVIDQTVLNGIPVIIFNGFRGLLKQVCGISSVVLGISKNIDHNYKLILVKKCIENIFQKCPAPINHINYNRSLDDEVCIVKSGNDENKSKPMEISETIDDEIIEALYLKRESKDKRVFVPTFVEEDVESDKMEVDITGFLAFSEDPPPIVKNKIVKPAYKSLVVKRLKGDPNRRKRKIETLKRNSNNIILIE